MFRKLGVLVALLALVLGACGKKTATTTTRAATASTGGTATTGGGAAGAQTFNVDVDTSDKSNPVEVTSFFPSELKARPGDSVKFTLKNFSEPHTVTFGTLVDAGFAKVTPDPNAPEPDELAKVLPDLIPDPTKDPTAKLDARQYAAQPCFLDSGKPPSDQDTACPKAEQKAFNGKQALYSSGWLDKDEVYSVKLDDSVAPGTYTFFCLLHRTGMSGKLTVVGKGDSVPTPDDVKKAGQAEIDKQVGFLKGPGQQFTSTPLGGMQAGAVNFAEQDARGQLTQFFPKDAKAKVGEPVKWYVLGPHTVSFGTSEADRTLRTKAPDGSIHINPKAAAPQNSAGQPAPPAGGPASPEPEASASAGAPPQQQGPPDPAELVKNAVPIDGGTYDGTGVKSPGLILSFGDPLFYYQLTFSKAGTYKYVCLIHPDMDGSITVS